MWGWNDNNQCGKSYSGISNNLKKTRKNKTFPQNQIKSNQIKN